MMDPMDPSTLRIGLTAYQMRGLSKDDGRYVIVEDRGGWRKPRTFGAFDMKEQAIERAGSLQVDALCVVDSHRAAEGTIWWKQRYAVFRERRFFPRSLYDTTDLDAAMTFARSAGRGVVVIDKNEDRLVWQGS
jgi:hypothetical protein